MTDQQPDTIVARASPPGRAARAIIRVSGPAVPGLIERYISPAPRPRGISNCHITIGSSRWDGRPARRELSCPALVLCAKAPATYTGEDALEIILPGNTHLVERVIDRLCSGEDVRRAGPGEFSARAYLNGKLSLDQAEGVAAVIAARTAEDLDAAKRLASGETGAIYRTWSEELVTLLALVEAGIDFTDQEDVVPIAPSHLHARIGRLGRDMEARFGGEVAAQSEGSPPLVVLLGEPNAGKSTLFNALLGRTRSVVAEEVGTTRDVLIEPLHLDEAAGPGLAVRLADLPGLETRDGANGRDGDPPAVAGAARERALDALARADAVIHCDPGGEFVSCGWTVPDAVPVLQVRTKADLPGAGGGDVAVCALDGWHLDAVRRGVADIALRAPGGSASVALARHAREIARAVELLDGVEADIDLADRAITSPELVADGLHGALNQLENVLGRVTPDEVIGRIFATFCVGK